MKSPFPGMDPYLEHHALWPDFHNSLITALRDAIVPLVAPAYYVGVEYIMKPDGDAFLGRPDIAVVSPGATRPVSAAAPVVAQDVNVLEVELPLGAEVNHYYLEIRSVQTHELVTLIELLSPANKTSKTGRADYLEKRFEATMSLTNYVEIDLLRAGDPMPFTPQFASDYRIIVNRGRIYRRKAQLYAFNLHAEIPAFALPLQPDDNEPVVPLNQIVHELYSRARFDLRIDYSQPPIPPLSEADTIWARELLAA
ncbi:MAG: DUF4058 family protein [Anaerolineales bacterium]|nr:DUF4058 family protein [Anaerolineales bacterium]